MIIWQGKDFAEICIVRYGTIGPVHAGAMEKPVTLSWIRGKQFCVRALKIGNKKTVCENYCSKETEQIAANGNWNRRIKYGSRISGII